MAKVGSGSSRAKSKSSKNESAPSAGRPSDFRLKVLICLLLVAITVVAYWQVFDCKFIETYDDQDYVTRNTFISSGLSPESIAWAFTTFRCSNWHPLTWISHMVDYQAYKLDPRGHHLTNLLLHIASSLVLFLLLNRMTGSIWRSGFVAALFAIHPLHVESVAWVAERKDVLSTFFGFAAIYAYVLHAGSRSAVRYAWVLIAFGLSLLSKPMLVSLPILLILLDYWPLNRGGFKWRLVWEKWPLWLMSLASCIVTMIAQRSGGAVTTLEEVTFGYRIGNAAVSYLAYLWKMIWPSGLAVFYSLFDTKLPVWEMVGAGVLLAAFSYLILRHGRRWPYLMVGWLWYLITLLPVIGLVQVGSQSMADRYSYIPLTGVFIIIAWSIPDLFQRLGSRFRFLLPAAAVVVIVAMAVCTWAQVGVWRDGYSLFDHAIKITGGNPIAYNNRGVALMQQGKRKEAIADFSMAVKMRPKYAEAHNNLGYALIASGKNDEGAKHIRTAMRLGLDTPALRYEIAARYFQAGELDLAAEQCRASLQLDPTFVASHNLLGTVLSLKGNHDEAIAHLQTAIQIAPDFADPHGNLAVAYFTRGDLAAAWREVHIFTRMGGKPNPQFIEHLASKMPDPGR